MHRARHQTAERNIRDGGGTTPIGWINGIASRDNTTITIDMPARYGDIFKVDLYAALKGDLNTPLGRLLNDQNAPMSADELSFFDIYANGMARIVTTGNDILSHQLKTGDDTPVVIPGGTGNYTYTTRAVNEKVQADVADTGILYLAPTLDMEALRSGQHLQDGTVSINFTVWARGEEYNFTVKLKLIDFDSAAGRVFFGDRDLNNPGYSKFNLNGEVSYNCSINNPLDVWRVEQRLKYLAFPAMGYAEPGADGFVGPMPRTNQIQDFAVDGSFGVKEELAVQLFQRVINGVSNGNTTTGAIDGVVSQNGNSWKWLIAYNAPHWMDIGSQMQYQTMANSIVQRTGYSLPGWNNTQTGSGTSVEQYGTSWTRDLMLAKSYANPAFLASLPTTGSRSNGIVDANYSVSLRLHSAHGAGMNFDLGINYSYITGAFLTSTIAVAGVNANLPSQPQPAPTTGIVQWSNQYALDLVSQLPNFQTQSPNWPNYLNDSSYPRGMNLQQAALRDFLALYSVTRNNGAEAYGWDDLPISNGSSAQREAIRTALFGDGTAANSVMRSVAIGGTGNDQAHYPGIEDVLTALGVPPNNGNFTLLDHYNHFHVNVQKPTNSPVGIVTTSNLLAEEIMTDRIVAAANTSQGSLGTAAATESQVRYDVAYSICQTVAPADYAAEFVEVANAIFPTNAAWKYFYDRGVRIESNDSLKVTLIDAPKHGVLENGQVSGAYLYKPNKDYLGGDRMIFSVEVKGMVFEVIYSVDVVLAPDSGSPSCPTGNGIKELPKPATGRNKQGSLDIWELPNSSQYDAETLAQMHSMLSFALGGVGITGNGSLNIADLQGAAIGQTTGSTITLDTNAAGHNWFIDPTPGSNEEWLPTSNPNEWVAKAGSAAEGKMDMLSVLLHEYGHALGIDHSADPHDYMGTTLQAGVRRLPSADEMALMQQLVSQAKAEMTATPSTPGDAPAFPTLPLSGSLIGFMGLLRGSRYGGVSLSPDASTLVTQYAVAANTTLTNGSLNAADGWSTQGSVDIGPSTGSGQAGGAAVMREVSGSQTRLSQVFMVNQRDRFLSFTLSGTALDDLTGAPDDAFEVALLDANTGASLLGGTGRRVQ